MGILEQINADIKSLNDKMFLMQKEIAEKLSTLSNNAPSKNEFTIKYKDNDILNVSVVAYILGIKKKDVLAEISKGNIQPTSDTKKIFTAKEVFRYKNAKDNPMYTLKNIQSKVDVGYNKNDIEELIKMQKDIV